MKYYLAIDLGATSGRHVVGHFEGKEIVLDEIYRFKTGMKDSLDGKVWDISLFFQEIKKGIKLAFSKYKSIESLAIDTWGVDYVLLKGDQEIPPFYSYRNKRNIKASNDLHKITPFSEIYMQNGIQFANFNTIYQLYDDLKNNRLDSATDYLMLPSYFTYKLTGIKSHEYTEESTTSLLNANTRDYNFSLLSKIGFPKRLFSKISLPGTIVGKLLPEIANEVGGQTNVILCASHDTASAFESIDNPNDSIIISSGTWSLLGVKLDKPLTNLKSLEANFTNEGGIGYIRYLKNIMGMWIVNQISEQENFSFKEMDSKLEQSHYQEIFDVNDQSLLSPKNMKNAVISLLKNKKPKNDIDLFNSIYHSLAYSYNKAIIELESLVNKNYKTIYIVGGGAKNKYLNRLVEQYTGKQVIALPIEATCIGNIKVQRNAGRQ